MSEPAASTSSGGYTIQAKGSGLEQKDLTEWSTSDADADADADAARCGT